MMSDNNPTLNSVIDTVDKILQDHFKENSPKRPNIAAFHASKEGLLGNMWRSNINVHVNPCKNHKGSTESIEGNLPNLLLFDLENKISDEDLKKSEVYQHIVRQQDLGPTCLYGTPGAGKTRALFEYLSCHKGFYLLAGDFERNAGSKDLKSIFQAVGKKVVPNTDEGIPYSFENLSTIECRFRVVLYIRHIVHGFLEEKLGSLRAWEWLMFQLFPDELLGTDIFHLVIQKCITKGLITEQTSQIARDAIKYTWSIFVDESQSLLYTDDAFFLSKDGRSMRSNFSALMKAIYSDAEFAEVKMKYPVFSGTGYSLDCLRKEERYPAIMKNPSYMARMQNYKQCFTSFALLDADRVKSYISTFLDLTDINDEVINHVSCWLRGRPRWTATFLETYVMQKRKTSTEGRTRVNGNFSEEDRGMLEALDRYLYVTTCDETTANRRASWNAGPSSAYSSISHLMDLSTEEAREAQKDLQKAVFNFAVGNRTTVITGNPSKRLIEAGVAAVRVERSVVAALLDEPIVAQAGINYFCLAAYLRGNLIAQEEHGLGQAFERLLLPVLLQDQKTTTSLQESLQLQLEGHNASELSHFRVSLKSSYGVLALDTKESMNASIDWIHGAINSKIEGQVPPFCYPDNNIGPDVIYLMWNQEYTDFRACLVQSKYERYPKQMDALRTLVPDWLYYKNRDKPSDRKLALSDNLANKWNNLKDCLVSDQRPCLRLLVQYPAQLTKAACSGQVAPDGAAPKDENATKRKRDWLVTISNKDLNLFDKETQDIIKRLKRPKTK